MKKEFRRTVLLVAFCLVFALAFAGCTQKAAPAPAAEEPPAAGTETPSQPAEPAPGDKQLLIGYIQAGPDIYYQSEVDGARYTTEVENGDKFVVVNSEYNQEKELANADDLITQGADAIILMTTNADVAQKVAQKCNDANVPLFLSAWEMTEGPGKSTGKVILDMHQSGFLVGEYVAKKFPGGKGYIITGVVGQGVGDPYTEGFMDGIDGSGITILDKQAGDWDRNKAIQVTQDMLTADPNVDFLFTENEDMAKGSYTVLKDMGLQDKIELYSMNGSPTGVQMLSDGELVATTNQAPTYYGMLLAQMAIDYVNGKPGELEISAPLTLITKDNIGDIKPWELDKLIAVLGK